MMTIEAPKYEVVTGRELMPSLILEIVKKAMTTYAQYEKESWYGKMYRAYVLQLYAIMGRDIKRLGKEDEYTPPLGNGIDDRDEWYDFFTRLWDLACELNYTGMDEKKTDFKGFLKTLKEGVMYGTK